MSRREENLKQLATLGIEMVDENQALQSALERAPEPEPPENQDDHLHGDPDPQPATPEPVKSPDEKHDWEKRKADAQAAQRALSKTQAELKERERAIESRLNALDEKERKLDELLVKLEQDRAPKQTVNQTGSEDDEIMQTLAEEYPDLFKAVNAAINRSVAPLAKSMEEERADRIRRDKEAKERAAADEEQKSKDRAERVINKVIEKHKDAVDVVASEEFIEWMDTLSPGIRKAYAHIIEYTYQYEPEDAISILDAFKKTLKPDPTNSRIPDSSPSKRPAGSPEAQPGNQVTPLSFEELGRVDQLMRQAKSQAERDFLRRRLDLTYQT